MPTPEVIEAYQQPTVELDVSEWYRNSEFRDWLTTNNLATWASSGQDPVEDASEVFLYVEANLHQGDPADVEGSEQSSAPAWVWEGIVKACRKAVLYKPKRRVLVILQNTNMEAN